MPHQTMLVCTNDPRITDATRSTSSEDDSLLRLIAAKQMLSVMPNFINTKKNGLVIRIIFVDGGYESYRHTTFSGWSPVVNSLSPPGTGSGSNCSRAT